MKKRIVLFLAAALVSVGLIMSCGGGGGGSDDDDPTGGTPGSQTPGGSTGVQYTVTFDTDGGEPAEIEPIQVNAGTASGGAKWPDDPEKDGYIFDGWFTADDTEYRSNTVINGNVALVAKYSLRPPKYLGGITWPNNVTQQGWRANNTDNTPTDLDIIELRKAKYIVLHTKGGNSDTAYGKLGIALQHNVGWAWNSTTIITGGVGGDVDFDRTKDNFIVLEISKLKGADGFSECVQGKILVDYASGGNVISGLGLQGGYFYYQNLEKPADTDGDSVELVQTVDGDEVVYGYITDVNQLGIDIPTSTVQVTFDSDGGTTVASIQVGTGKDIGVKFPWWVTRDASDGKIYDYDGWYNNNTEYTASTPITAAITLTAKWAPTTLPIFDDTKDITFVGKYTVGNAIGFNGYDGDLDWELFTDSKYLILLFRGSNSSTAGKFANVQIVIQGHGNSQGWNMNESNGSTDFSVEPDEFAYLVVDITKLKDYDACAAEGEDVGNAKFVLNYGMTNYKCAWLTSEDLVTTGFTAHDASSATTTGVFFLTKTLGLEATP